MKCRICEKHFNLDSSFTFLFYFPEICPSCKERFNPEIKLEKIPVDNGEITLIYFYDFFINLIQRNYLDRYHTIFYKFFLKSLSSYEMIIFLDDSLFSNLASWWELIVPFENILFCSLTYYDFSKTIYFD